jgi:hypothetical protein
MIGRASATDSAGTRGLTTSMYANLPVKETGAKSFFGS